MASELHPWRFELEIFPSRLPCGHVFEPKLNAQQGAICEAFFFFFFFRRCFGSHFFVARSHRFIAICHCRFLASFKTLKKKKKKKKAWKENSFVNFSLQPTAAHSRSACFKTDLPDHFRFNFVQVVTEPCGSVVLLWGHGGHVTETRDFQLQTTQMLEASCLFSFKSILLRTSGKCQSIKRTACMLNFIYIVQSKWYLRLKISVQGPFNHDWEKCGGRIWSKWSWVDRESRNRRGKLFGSGRSMRGYNYAELPQVLKGKCWTATGSPHRGPYFFWPL